MRLKVTGWFVFSLVAGWILNRRAASAAVLWPFERFVQSGHDMSITTAS